MKCVYKWRERITAVHGKTQQFNISDDDTLLLTSSAVHLNASSSYRHRSELLLLLLLLLHLLLLHTNTQVKGQIVGQQVTVSSYKLRRKASTIAHVLFC